VSIEIVSSDNSKLQAVFSRTQGLPWHFGMNGGATDENMSDTLLTIPAALERTGIGSQSVDTVPLYTRHPVTGEFVETDRFVGVQNLGNGDVYGTAGKDTYQAKNFGEQLMVVHRALESINYDPACLDSLFMLGGGAVCAATLSFPSFAVDLADGTKVLPFLNWISSHDGSKAFDLREHDIRQVCANTVALSQSYAPGRRGKARHTLRMDDQMAKMVASVMAIPDRLAELVAQSEALLGFKISDDKVPDLVSKIVDIPVLKGDGSNQKAVTMATNKAWDIFNLYQTKPDLQDVRGTAWGVYNAFTDYVDHFARFNNSKNANADQNRYLSVVWGNDTLADKALTTLVGMASEADASKIAR